MHLNKFSLFKTESFPLNKNKKDLIFGLLLCVLKFLKINCIVSIFYAKDNQSHFFICYLTFGAEILVLRNLEKFI